MTGFVGNIENLTLKNNYFREVLFTGKHAQLVVMCLQPGEEIGNEVHQNVDQFFRIEARRGKIRLQRQGRAHCPRQRCSHCPGGHLSQCHQHIQDQAVETVHGLFAAEPSGWNDPQDQSGGGGSRKARTSLKPNAFRNRQTAGSILRVLRSCILAEQLFAL